MESITIKMEESMAKQMDQSMKQRGYSTKTEFIREAIRDKLEANEQELLIKEFMKFKGKAKKKTTYEDNRKTREKVSKELMEELKKRFS